MMQLPSILSGKMPLIITAVVASLLSAAVRAEPLPPPPLFTVPLDKQYVPVVRNGATVTHKTAYFGQVHTGLPTSQTFTVVFDTGSGHFFLPSASCKTEACAKHRRFDRAASPTAEDINHDGSLVGAGDNERDEVSVVYGTGEITGSFVRESVCLHNNFSPNVGPSTTGCASVRIVLAHDMTEEPFGSFGFDGVIGLGLDALSLDPEFNFFQQLSKGGAIAESRFGYFLSRVDSVPSEISFGGHDERRTHSELRWADVHRPELGYWQVKIRSIKVGGKILPDCQDGGCSAIADTGTSLLGVPKGFMRGLHMHLARKVPGDPEELNCRHFAGPDLVFELEGGIVLELGPADYSRAAAVRVLQGQGAAQRAQVICRASLMPVEPDMVLGSKTWILGEPVLQKYYTAYDFERKSVGFALAKQPEGVSVAPGEVLTPAVVHI